MTISSSTTRMRHETGVVATLVAAALVVGMPLTASASARPRQISQAQCRSSLPYTAGEFGYGSFRIPAIIRAHRYLLAFAEGRHDGTADSGNIDIVLRRSSDEGCTWGPLQVVASGDGNTRDNPAPVYDPFTRQVVLLSCYNGGNVTETDILEGEASAADTRRVFVQTSSDDGATFDRPREITAQTKRPNWRWYATGPGHAVVVAFGPHRGRIVVPADHSTAPPPGSGDTGAQDKYYGGHDIYSDDGGNSWHIGYVDDTPDGVRNVNETSVTELTDGRLYFNARNQDGTDPATRLDAYSVDGGTRLLSPFRGQPALIGPVVEGSVLQARGGPLLYSGPADPTSRADMTIRVSYDAGRSWPGTIAISEQPAAYSDLVQLRDHEVGLLYETGASSSSATITFVKVHV